MTTTTVRADELCGKHIGMWLEGHEIGSIDHSSAEVSVWDETTTNIGDFAQDSMLTLSDTLTPDLPTEPGALVAASLSDGWRAVFMRQDDKNSEAFRWESHVVAVDEDEALSDPVELVAVPKKEYEALVEASDRNVGDTLDALNRLIGSVDALESSLS